MGEVAILVILVPCRSELVGTLCVSSPPRMSGRSRAVSAAAAAATLAGVAAAFRFEAFAMPRTAAGCARQPGVVANAGAQAAAPVEARVDGSIGYNTAWLTAAAAAMIGAAGAAAHRRRRSCLSARGGDEEEGTWMGAEKYSALTGDVPLVKDNVDVAKILPHRYPFLLVDKIIEFEPGKRAVGVKNVTANEPQFTGHFPDRPIMPGVLMVEALAQLGGTVCLQQPVSDGTGNFFFAGIDGVKFRRPVVPGDTLVMEATLEKFREKFGIAKMSAKAYVDGEVALEVKSMTFALVKEE